MIDVMQQHQQHHSSRHTGKNQCLWFRRASLGLHTPSAAKEAGIQHTASKHKKTHVFHFKEFSVAHGQVGMKVGTDSILLGSWADVPAALANSETPAVLDVGTGSGVLALMIAQRAPWPTCIHAIDVESIACQQAAANAASSPWAARVHVFCASFQTLAEHWLRQHQSHGQQHRTKQQERLSAEQAALLQHGELQATVGQVLQLEDWQAPTDGYDLIICNPPYFLNGYLPPGLSQTATPAAEVQASSEKQGIQQSGAFPLHTSSASSASDADDACPIQHAASQTRCISMQTHAGQTDTQQEASKVGEGATGSTQAGTQNAVLQRALARHVGAAGMGLTYKELTEGASALLAPGGALFIVLPAQNNEAQHFQTLATQAGLHMVRLAHVYGAAEQGASPIRWLMQFIKPKHIQTAEAFAADVQPAAAQTSSYAGQWHSSYVPRESDFPMQELQPEVIVVNRTVQEKAALGFACGAFVPTQQYIQLTKDYHSPNFVNKWSGI